MVSVHFPFFLYLLFSCHLVGNLASGCSLLGLLDPFSAFSYFLHHLAHQCVTFARPFFYPFWDPICQSKTHQKRDQIWGASGRRDVLLPPSIPRWALLGPAVGFWSILGPSWGVCGALLGHPGAILGPSWGHLGSWGILGPSWAILRPSWGHFAEG